MIKVCLIFRRSNVGNFSIEGLFNNLYKDTHEVLQIEKIILPHRSTGLLKKIANIIYVRKLEADIFHITGDVNYLTPFLHKGKTVLTVHDCSFMTTSSGIKKVILWFFWIYWPTRAADIITAVSKQSKTEISRYARLSRDQVQVIYNFCNPIFKRTPKYENESFTILHIGTKENKNLNRLIRAVKGLDVRLLIVGVLNIEQQLLLDNSGVTYSNARNLSDEELFVCYKSADIVSFISTYEGFGLPILEAQSVGRAVITSNLSSMPEVAGNAALFVDPLDEDSIREGVLLLKNDSTLRNNLVNLGFDNLKRFSRDFTAQMYTNLYQSIFQNRD